MHNTATNVFRTPPWLRFVEDGAERDEDGYYTITGRIDDVMNVSGHRIGTMEVESALVGHEAVAEAAVIGCHDEDKGQAIVAYVILEGDREGSDELIQELNQQARKAIGPHARPEEIIFTPTFPRRGAARSCATYSGAWPKARTTSAIPRGSPTPPS